MRYRLTIAYDGTGLGGWQGQPNAETVQAQLESAIKEFSGTWTRVYGSGRTDAGVHARGQIAHFESDTDRPPDRWKLGLNALLPVAIRIVAAERAASNFHARFDARWKEYRYHLWNGRDVPPLLRHWRHHERRPLDLDRMREAAARLPGTHNFQSFSANAEGADINNMVRTLFLATIEHQPDAVSHLGAHMGDDLLFRFRGSGFLYKMVRRLSGFLILVGEGQLAPEDADEFLANPGFTARIKTAPAKGLVLWEVGYTDLNGPPAPA